MLAWPLALLRINLSANGKLYDAHITNQCERLARSAARRHTLQELSIGHFTNFTNLYPIPTHIHASLTIKSLPRNMHPEHNIAGRKKRTEALHKIHNNNPNTICVDAAEYRHHGAYAVSII